MTCNLVSYEYQHSLLMEKFLGSLCCLNNKYEVYTLDMCGKPFAIQSNHGLCLHVIRVQTSQPIQVSVTDMFSLVFTAQLPSVITCASPPDHLDIIIKYKKVLLAKIDVLIDIIASAQGEEDMAMQILIVEVAHYTDRFSEVQ